MISESKQISNCDVFQRELGELLQRHVQRVSFAELVAVLTVCKQSIVQDHIDDILTQSGTLH